jgi:hypothetical protein
VKRFEQAATPLAIGSLSRAEPIRARSYEADAGVLAAQAGITALLLFLLIVVAVLFPVSVPGWWLGEWREWSFSAVLATVKAALLVALLVGLVAWGWLVYSSTELLWKREHMMAAPETPAPLPAAPATCRIEVDLRSFNGHLRKAWLDVPVPAESFATFARAALNGQPVAQARWIGKGKPFTRSEFEDMRGWLMEMSLAEWLDTRNHDQGWNFTHAGRHVLGKWLEWHAGTRKQAGDTENEPMRGPEGE